MYRKVLILAGVLVIALAAPAAAQYGPSGPTVQAPSGTLVAGESITVSGQGFPPNTEVIIYFKRAGTAGRGTRLGTVMTDSNGNFTAQVRVPSFVTAGDFTITAVAGAVEQTTNVHVGGTVLRHGSSTTGGTTGHLPRTGTSSIVPLTAIGAALVAAGGGVMLFTRQRPSARQSAGARSLGRNVR